MTGIPVDSADVAEQREREQARAEAEQERADVEAAQEVSSRRRCADLCKGSGWAGEDDQGRPIPCPIHKPDLLHMPCSTCGATWNGCQAKLQARRGGCCDLCLHIHRKSAQ